jgi:hypothetical protein
MLAGILAIFTAIAPYASIVIPIGEWLINSFIKDQAQKDANLKAFLDAVSAHSNDALASVNERENAWEQRQDLLNKAKEADKAAQDANKAAQDANKKA